jgi:hypothetical protein
VDRAFECAISEASRRSTGHDRPSRAFAAAHLFGSWAAYQCGGLGAVVDAVRLALRTLRQELGSGGSFVEAARATDFALRHTN